MAVSKRQGREKPAKIEQRKVKGRSKDQSEDFRQNKQHSWLSPICIGQVEVEEKKHIKGGAKHARSHSLSLSSMHRLLLSLSPLPPTPPCTLLHSLLFKDGFSCYLLNKIEL